MSLLIYFAALIVVLAIAKTLTQRRHPKPIIPTQSTKVDDDVPSTPPAKKIIVVTGGNGFFGAECTKHLLEHSDYEEIRVFDLAGHNVPQNRRVKFVKGTIVDLKDCLAVVEGAEAVLHIGAIVDLRSSEFYTNFLESVNVMGTWNMLEASIRRGVRSFVYTSSNATLSSTKRRVVVSNEQEVLECWSNTVADSVYGRTKKAAALLSLAANGLGRLSTCVLIPGAIMGPNEPRMLSAILGGDPTRLHHPSMGGPLNFIWSKSFARAQLAAVQALTPTSPNYKKTVGHAFMMYDFYDNCVVFETNLRLALGYPEGNYLPTWAAGVLARVVYVLNWITNDKKNWIVLQATSAANKFVSDSALMNSNSEATEAFGWKPSTEKQLLDDVAAHYAKKKQ